MSERFVTNRPNSHMERQREPFSESPRSMLKQKHKRGTHLQRTLLASSSSSPEPSNVMDDSEPKNFYNLTRAILPYPIIVWISKISPANNILLKASWSSSSSPQPSNCDMIQIPLTETLILRSYQSWFFDTPIVWISNSSQANNPASASSSPQPNNCDDSRTLNLISFKNLVV